MEAAPAVFVAVSMAVVVLLVECGVSAEAESHVTYSSRLIHRFSDEMRALRVSREGQVVDDWPEEGSLGYYRRLVRRDVERQKMNVGSQHQLLFPSAGSVTMSGGNELGWLHYTWIAVGVPSVSFLVALDTGSDLLWLPCDCVQCAPLSVRYYDNDLNEYNPSHSSTSKSITCSHQLCESGPTCKSSKQSCPYTVKYATTDTSSSGSLVEDILHLASAGVNASNTYVRAPVIIGCGREQSGGYLDGIAPDGVLGLGLGAVSVPSFLAKSGVTRNAFSLCFGEAGTGEIYFGDQGLAGQRTTPFLPIDGKYIAYIIGVENFCIGTTCLDQTTFRAQFDSGTTFTLLPDGVYKLVVEEFDRQANATKYNFEDLPFQHCYKSSSQQLPEIPSVTIRFAVNNSFVVHDPLFVLNDSQGGLVGFCLAIQSSPNEMGIIGQNFMKGYRLVFDRENLTLGWSRSKCQAVKGEKTTGSNASSPISLPTTEQQRTPSTHAVSPAVAGRAPPSKSSATSILSNWSSLSKVLLLVPLLFHQLTRCKYETIF
ncbi:aspartic proteinase-like protein 1 isoform X1 [Cynara cardunculus var. scolymus]|uniref:aspartic proteinase-like protein 1 isoform X1 n=1 Tax=Cynara cardunculus var. scolymus TaxID=59895 RepID=UPI000D62C161|nr:aspartic proteinase-like protein 1 isoform X1 [Cynara cardunculus var. scolymus]